MADLVVTVPMDFWADWLEEGDLAGEAPGGAFEAYDFTCGPAWQEAPPIAPGERVYVVAHGRIRGYAPLVELMKVDNKWSLVRSTGAVAVTTAEHVRGFRGWKERWWPRESEVPFPAWQTEGVKLMCCRCTKRREIVGYLKQPRDPLCAWCAVAALDKAKTESREPSAHWLAIEPTARAIVERQRNVDEYDALAAEAQPRSR